MSLGGHKPPTAVHSVPAEDIVTKIDAPDDKTVVITTDKPSAPLLSTLAMFAASIVPEAVVKAFSLPQMPLTGTSLLIVVNVTMDTVTQIQSHLLAHQYGDLIKKAKLKGGALRR